MWVLLILMLMATPTIHGRAPVVEIPEFTDLNGSQYNITTLMPQVFLHTGEFLINSSMCLHYSFKLLETRVKLLSHTCQLSTGGYCVLDKFTYPKDTEGCTYLRPWKHHDDRFKFYFILERRPRKLGAYYHQRVREGKRKRHVVRRSTKVIGQLNLYGLVDCKNVCNLGLGEKKLGSYSDGTFHSGRASRYNK
ncbi:hypothetical protein L5515_013148 [Caenorhabditis briggsae]|uniref:Uncharacterized protein n=1 Tax=Caenorhabditis briggsae TaxID=6238 RepID=A0AAE9J528_CAEBR|nr:hypothetical protein L3Y34_016996 [Caenorhabditis briggsae]UMM15920.1 hypothetical protein L5515_013148 [Caenorhabditis briggsae]